MKFVDEIADYVFTCGKSTKDISIILPSERMRKYVQHAIARKFNKPVLSPKILTIDQWVRNSVPEIVIDRTAQLLLLYNIHQTIEHDPLKASFEEFMSWGELLLNDLGDIDRYLVDPKSIFRNLAEIKEIENWSFNSTELSEGQRRFMEFWDTLPTYYERFHEKLSHEGLAYTGQCFRKLSSNIDLVFKENSDAFFLFAGFNALSASEVGIINQLVNMGKAVFFVDADDFYMSRRHHEAGTFIRAYLDKIKPYNAFKDGLSNKEMAVEIIACTQHTGQVKALASELSKLEGNGYNDTLILLADESLITSVVKNLPKSIGKANISMGIPLRSTSIRTFVEAIFSIQLNFERFKTEAFYFKDLLKLIKHPFIQSSSSESEIDRMIELEKKIIDKNQIFISFKGLNTVLKENDVLFQILQLTGNPWRNSKRIFHEDFKLASTFLFERLDTEFAFERAALEAFYRCIISFEALKIEDYPELSLKSVRQLFDRHWMNESIAYHGNPIDGLQITGLLETRGIDFKTIFCIGLNEGKLPPTNPLQSLIPMDLRRYHNLPLPRDKQGIFGHHFYRLLHHCERMVITYSNADSPMGVHEPSRFIMQLEKELGRENQSISIVKKTYVLENTSNPTPVIVQKTPGIIERLDDLIERSVSASMLRNYLTCPLDFYYKYLLGFGDAKEVEEDLEAATFGTLIHRTLEILYEPYARIYFENEDGKRVQKERKPQQITSLVIDQLLKNYPVVLESCFKKHFNNNEDAYSRGNNYLAFKIANEMTGRFLKNERQFVMSLSEPMFIEALEFRLEVEKEIEVNGEIKTVRFKGFADRIDRIGDNYRIIDYKSGKVDKSQASFGNAKSSEEIPNYFKSKKFLLQLTQYTWMYKELYGKDVSAGIYSFLDNRTEFIALNFSKLDPKEVVRSFPEKVALILSEMYNSEIPFTHADNYFSYCNYCN